MTIKATISARAELFLLGIVVSLLGCGACKTSKPESDSTFLHILVGAHGKVELRKQDWTHYSAVGFGTSIETNDILRVAEGGSATVICSDLSEANLRTARPGPVPCPARGELVALTPHLLLRGESSGCPSALAPRSGLLLDMRPEVQWMAVPETRNYRVSLRAGVVSWQREVHLTEDAAEGRLPYPTDAPPLPPGSPLAVTISGGGRSSDQCPPRESSLRTLTTAEQSVLQRAEDRIRGLGLSNANVMYLRANLLLSHELYAEAISLLRQQEDLPGTSPAVYRLLGDAYVVVELADHAEKAYQSALDRVVTGTDIQAEASLNASLARLTGDDVKRARFTSRAVQLYRELGDQKAADALLSGSK